MATYLVDTSVIIDALNNKRGRRDLLLSLLRQGHLLACCAINVAEVYAGIRPKEEAATEEFLRTLEYYHVTWPVARLAGLLRRNHLRKGVTLTLTDTTIAAVALAHELTLMTDNVKDFPMKELSLYPFFRLADKSASSGRMSPPTHHNPTDPHHALALGGTTFQRDRATLTQGLRHSG